MLVLDAAQDISDQDAHIAGFALEAGRALVVAINKWDAVDDCVATVSRPTSRASCLPLVRAFHQISALKAGASLGC